MPRSPVRYVIRAAAILLAAVLVLEGLEAAYRQVVAPGGARVVVGRPAQYGTYGAYGPRSRWYGYGGGYGYGWGGGGGTVAGNYYSGLGQALRGQGQYNLLTSQAVTQMEQAKALAIENHVKQVEAYNQLREMNRQYRDAHAKPKRTPEEWARINRAPRPPKLTASELDPATGQLRWQPILAGSDFDAERAIVDKLMAERAARGGALAGDDYETLNKALHDMIATLKSKIDSLPSGDYMQAKNFIQSIEYEVTVGDGA